MKKIIVIGLILLCSKNALVFCQETAYEFISGQYYILDYPINIRSQPNLKGEIIGKLNLHDKISILEKTNNIQKIDDVTAYWYKIRFNDITGYIFGGYISVDRLVVDIDQNGVNDFIYYRYSKIRAADNHLGYEHLFDTHNDLMIYINNKKIDTKNIYRDLPENHLWMGCDLNSYSYSKGEYVRIGLSYSRGTGFPDEMYYFRIYGNGNITLEYKNMNSGRGYQ